MEGWQGLVSVWALVSVLALASLLALVSVWAYWFESGLELELGRYRC